MRFVLTINCDGEAFKPSPGEERLTHAECRELEVAEILHAITKQLMFSESPIASIIEDTDGELCGHWRFEDGKQ